MADMEAEWGSNLVKFLLIVVGNAANEVDGQRFCLLAPGSGEDVAQEELLEAVEEELVDGWMLTMPCAERTERGKEAVG